MKKKYRFSLFGAAAGIANGIFGSGGGIIAVPLLKNAGLETKKAHACSLALTLPFSVISSFFYALDHSIDLNSAIVLIPFGLAGAAAGALCMKKLPTKWLSRIFGIILIIAGVNNLLS